MALSKRTILDQVEVKNDGHVQVRLRKEVADGDEVVAFEYHRTVVVPGGDSDAQMGAVNAHLDAMGWPAVNAADIAAVAKHVKAATTPATVAAYQARVLAAENAAKG